MPSKETTPPDPGDLEGWRKAVQTRSLGALRPEAIVHALQELGPHADASVREPLARHLSEVLMKMLRKYIGNNHPNDGEDIIDGIHSEMFIELLDKDSADGCALREAFGPRVQFRAKDVIATEYKNSRIPLAPKLKKTAANDDDNAATNGKKATEVGHLVQPSEAVEETEDLSGFVGDDAIAGNSRPDPALLIGVAHIDGEIDVKRALANITDHRKRLAFRLLMEDVPNGSKKAFSIAEAVGVSSKTVEKWLEELKALLADTDEVRELQGQKVGERS